ncbi:TatD family hydrolase [Sphingobacterium wenxiniae]|uniref:TatD DNase family protein n=1 Tax=Sphingobacterium wenxiniae TaxID=683125 RepID=A0A1I6Q7E0_9SPHI|nr:TatD family hydrolase [Sphingobacterium wenxiniae]SFS48342.1 TatD DNase family protein [Sphingobacterium wenxiniae]
MSTPYINIHTHSYQENTTEVFSLPNIIIAKDYLIPQPCSLGIHPWYIHFNYKEQEDILYTYAKRSNVWAIGECGLDKLTDSDFSLQKEIFRIQIKVANQLKKPLIIHCVRAYQECFRILQEERVQVPVIFHGFDKNIALAYQIYRQGYYISLGSALLKGQKDDLIIDFPWNKIFLETDDKSINIVDIYMYFCRVRKTELPLLKEQLYQNFIHVFNYPLKEE